MKALSQNEIKEFLSSKLQEWIFDGDFLKREFKFKSFVEAFAFMTAVALKAEKMDHHPDWSNVYNTVTIKLQTHSANGITNNDIDLAMTVDRIYSQKD